MYDVPVTTSEQRGVRYNMAIFEIQQDYTETGTKYYEVEAITLEEAIEKVQGRVLVRPPFKERVWDYEDSYDDSFEYKPEDEWIPPAHSEQMNAMGDQIQEQEAS